MIVTRTSASFGIALLVTSEPMRAIRSLFQLGRVRARACARYGVLVVGEEMKGLVNCNFLPGSARRLELGTVSAEPLSRAYWSQKLRLGETVGLSRARTSGESPDSTQAGRGPQWPIQLAAISAHPAAMVGTASTLYRLDGREQISAASLLCGGFLPRKRDLHIFDLGAY